MIDSLTIDQKTKKTLILEDLTEQLETYFQNSKTEFSFGVQNFQGIREYTKIPLAPLTLLHGQNSVGKSTIHDIQEFIVGFFNTKWDTKNTADHLGRWANHFRHSKPLTKGYLGKPDDVVISISSTTGELSYFDWEGEYHQNQDFITDGLANTVFAFGAGSENSIPFRVDFHFSDSGSDSDWRVRNFSLYLGNDLFMGLDLESAVLRLSRSHSVYELVDNFFDGVDKLLKDFMDETSSDDDFLVFSNIDTNSQLEWKKPISWLEYDNSNNRPTSEVLELRTFLLASLIIPTKGIFRDFQFTSVAPLRPIPSKRSAVFRCKLNPFPQSTGWMALAEQVCMKLIDESYSVDQRGKDEIDFSDLDAINRMLSHPMFLNTDYELTGDCSFITPIGAFDYSHKSNADMRELLCALDVEVHLKLRHKLHNAIVEIEDVGVGISQIISVLMAVVEGGNVFIQQPELHLHPKLQSQLADAFIEGVNIDRPYWRGKASFIIESHSEHFLLRLLRRIRETHKSDIRHKLFGLSADQVSVLYVDKLEDGSSKIFPLRISTDGEFIDRWPHGFFTERDGELFDE
ncbi:MAG: DUF3696 domain-containing protein [Methylobacter sp.]